ncbi:hypothetical protein DNTS_017218, partial [Danionella cerebrum]
FSSQHSYKRRMELSAIYENFEVSDIKDMHKSSQRNDQDGSRCQKQGFIFLTPELKSWSESRQFCRDNGADLVMIKSKEKQRLVSGKLVSSVWIGLSDAEREGVMKWVDNSPLNGGFWEVNEPNDAGANEDCVELNPKKPNLNNWNDIPCSLLRKALCERLLVSPVKVVDRFLLCLSVSELKIQTSAMVASSLTTSQTLGSSPRAAELLSEPLKMEMDTIYENVDAPGNEKRGAHASTRRSKCCGRRCLVSVMVTLGLICAVLLIFISLELLSLMELNHKVVSLQEKNQKLESRVFSLKDQLERADSKQGADLVVIKTQEKQMFISSWVQEHVWIGLVVENGKSTWVDDSSLDGGFWDSGEPNSLGGAEGCVELMPEQPALSNWNDLACTCARKAIYAMAKVQVLNVAVLDNPSPFGNPFQFEITFECMEDLPEDLEWKIIYVGSAESEEYDQVLDSVLVGPVPAGRHMFVFQADAPNTGLIPESDAVGVTVVLITCTYRGQEFIRIGYYVNNEYTDSELKENPPVRPNYAQLQRNILASNPRVTRFHINWEATTDRMEDSENVDPTPNAMHPPTLPIKAPILGLMPDNSMDCL